MTCCYSVWTQRRIIKGWKGNLAHDATVIFTQTPACYRPSDMQKKEKKISCKHTRDSGCALDVDNALWGALKSKQIMFSYVVLQSATPKSAFTVRRGVLHLFVVSVMDALPSAKWYKPLFDEHEFSSCREYHWLSQLLRYKVTSNSNFWHQDLA